MRWDTTSPYLNAVISNLSAYEQFKVVEEDKIRDIIISKSEEFNIDPQILLTLAKCESRFDPKAKNPKSTASGIFQFVKITWESTIKELGREDFEVFNSVHNTHAAAYLYSKKGIKPWLASYECWKNDLQISR